LAPGFCFDALFFTRTNLYFARKRFYDAISPADCAP
jgi:hypothetical protein